MAKDKERPYDASDLKELMDNAGGWAKNWDDVLLYLHGPAPYDSDFARDEVPALIKDISDWKKRKVDFTTDYRQVWHATTGESAKSMKPPEGVKEPKTNPRELEERYLKGLKFPARRGDVLNAAKDHDAPPRVMDVLKKVDDKEYRDVGMLLEEVGDLTWDHDDVQELTGYAKYHCRHEGRGRRWRRRRPGQNSTGWFLCPKQTRSQRCRRAV